LLAAAAPSQTAGEHSAHRHVKGEGLPPEVRKRVGALHVLQSTERVCLTTIELWLCTLVSHAQQRKASSLSQCNAAGSPQSAHRRTSIPEAKQSKAKQQMMLACFLSQKIAPSAFSLDLQQTKESPDGFPSTNSLQLPRNRTAAACE